MFGLGIILPICFVPGITGASLPTQWAVLSVAMLPSLWLRAPITRYHLLGLLALVYAGLTFHSVQGLWFTIIVALAFWFGSASRSLSGLIRGLAVGLSASSVVAVGQWLGGEAAPGGLLYNPAVQAIAIALVILALAGDRGWLYIPAMLPGLLVAGSRGAWLVLAIGLASHVLNWRSLMLLLLTAAALAVTLYGPSDAERLQIWSLATQNLTLFGHGAGAFADMVYFDADGLLRNPEHVHDDYLQLGYELGVGAVPILIIYGAALARTESKFWPAFVAFAAAGVFFFPLYSPLLAFIGAAVAGHLLRGDDRVRLPRNGGGFNFISRLSPARSSPVPVRDVAVSAAPPENRRA